MLERMWEQYKAREPDWRGRHERYFRWSKLRYEWGRFCYIVHPVEGGHDIVWWEWDNV